MPFRQTLVPSGLPLVVPTLVYQDTRATLERADLSSGIYWLDVHLSSAELEPSIFRELQLKSCQASSAAGFLPDPPRCRNQPEGRRSRPMSQQLSVN